MPEIINNDLLYQTVRRINCEFSKLKPNYTLQHRTKKFNLPDRGIKNTTFKKIVSLANKKNLISTYGRNELEQRKESLTFKCDKCNIGININKYKKEDFVKQTLAILKERPAQKNELDHRPLIPYFTIIRAAAIYELDRLYDKRIIFIGDYDSTSMALAILAKPKEMVVVDIDEDLMAYFNTEAKKHNFKITTIKHDLRKPLPKQLLNRFDIFITDPPYAIKGMNTFIERGISALKEGGCGYIATPFHDNLPWTGEMSFEIQSMLVKQNCIMTDILKNFHEYQDADGLTSSLIRIKKAMRYHAADKKSFYWWKEDRKMKNAPIIII